MSGHKYDPKHAVFLDSEERKKRQRPEDILSFLGIEEDDTILDLGAGTGFLTFPLAERAKEGKIYAVDVQKEMVKKLKDRCEEEGVDNVEVLLSGESDIPLPDSEVNKTYMLNVLHEIDDFAALEEVHRVMKKGGKMLIVDWDKEKTTERGPPTNVRLTRREAVQAVEEKRFKVLDMRSKEDHYRIIAEKSR